MVLLKWVNTIISSLAPTNTTIMLDNRSLDVISKFKMALLTRSQESEQPQSSLSRLNRGKKLPDRCSISQSLQPKVVDYEGSNRLVLTNDVIERSNYRNKRRWLDYHRLASGKPEVSDSSSDESVDSDNESYDSNEDEEENPLKKVKIGELLAPLTHPSEVVTHPAISKTYRLPCLSNLASELIDLIEVEQNTLNNLNKLLRVLNGEDWFFFLDDKLGLPKYDHGLDEAASKRDGNSVYEGEPLDRLKSKDYDATQALEEINGPKPDESGDSNGGNGDDEQGGPIVDDPFFALPKTLEKYEKQQVKQMEESNSEEDDLELVQQDLINFLQVSIQRQQEYIKNLQKIRMGIVGADRYKNDLYKWSKEMCEKR